MCRGLKVSRLTAGDEKSGTSVRRGVMDQSITVNDLLEKAVQNEQIMHRYQQFELKMLDLVDLESLLDLLLIESLDYFQLDSVEMMLYDPQNTLVELLSEDYPIPAGLQFVSNTSQLNRLFDSKLAVKLVAIPQLDKLPVFRKQQLRSAALLPLVRQGVLVGSLHFGAKGHQRFAIDKSTDFIAHLASIAAASLEHVVNQERLHRLSLYDVLTKVKNRRAFHQALDEEVSRSARNGDPLSLLFVDLDNFKQINDTYGHPMGDKVLNVVAQFINDMLRKTDHVCRYGGEEFALVLPNCDKQLALEVAERLRQKVSELTIEYEGDENSLGALVSITMSLGACCWQPSGFLSADDERQIVKELIDCSDRGVYQSKAAGRNCIHYVFLGSEKREPFMYSESDIVSRSF